MSYVQFMNHQILCGSQMPQVLCYEPVVVTKGTEPHLGNHTVREVELNHHDEINTG